MTDTGPLDFAADLASRIPPKPVGWHRHRYSPWGEPFPAEGDVKSSNGDKRWFQSRRCLVCNRVQRRRSA